MTEYSTRDEFIQREIVAALADGYLFTDDPRLEYDIDAIADEVIDSEVDGLDVVFFERDGIDFWDIVANHAIDDGDYRILWEESEDGLKATAHLMQWSSEDEKFNDIDSKTIRAAQYRAVNSNINHYDVEAILEMRHDLNDVIVVSDLR